MSSPRPLRRRTTHVETLLGELCIYEWTTMTVHALNPVASRVWEMCDGTITVTGIIAAVRRDEDTPAATLIVQHALAQFERAGLLEPDSVVGAPPVSRRRLLRTIGVAAIPVVTSIVAPPPAAAQSSRTRRFDFTGAVQFFTVPAGVTLLRVDALGSRGTFFIPFNPPGNGGRVQATLPVTPGEVLTVMVGSQGNALAGTGGFNGGAVGAYGGGGASDLRRGSTRLLVAGGGGGGGLDGGAGGNGGGLVGGSGTGTCGAGGGGGTQAAGGTGGAGGLAAPSGSPGVSGTGGNGGSAPGTIAGGGGGGGYFGGGGGGACGTVSGGSGGGGGGGSSFTDPSATSVVHTQGVNVGDGSVTFNW
jgi:hypothetical protein